MWESQFQKGVKPCYHKTFYQRSSTTIFHINFTICTQFQSQLKMGSHKGGRNSSWSTVFHTADLFTDFSGMDWDTTKWSVCKIPVVDKKCWFSNRQGLKVSKTFKPFVINIKETGSNALIFFNFYWLVISIFPAKLPILGDLGTLTDHRWNLNVAKAMISDRITS